MNCSVRDIVESIVSAGTQNGADGHGKDGLVGRLFMLARNDHKGFGVLLETALRLKMKAKPDERDRMEGKYLTDAEAKARLREFGIPVEVLRFLTPYDLRNLPAELPDTAGPNGTRDITEAIINAATRHGGDGHGKDGLLGFLRLLQVTEPRTFSTLTGLAQRWQATSKWKRRSHMTPTRGPRTTLRNESELFRYPFGSCGAWRHLERGSRSNLFF
jgi:hypothetical protein